MRPALLCLIALAAAAPGARGQVSPADSAALVRITQDLLDAITAGDSTVWAAQLAPGFFLTDEEGQHLPRAKFLRALHPLPAGQSGSLSLGARHLTGDGRAAVLSYDIAEWHNYYGQELRTRFHATDTWVRGAGGWRLLASQITALPTPVPGRPLPRGVADGYTGTYALTDAITLEIAADDSGLVVRRTARPAERLRALDDRLFVRDGVRGFWVFERDSAGAVTQLVQWRDNNAVVWRRR